MSYTILPLSADITANGVNQGDLVTLLRNLVSVTNHLLGAEASLQGDGILGNPTLAGGSNADDVANAAFEYMINGNLYNKAAVTAGTAPGTDVVPQSLYGAVAFEIGTNGTVDAVSAPANATGYASAAAAVAALPAVAADHARMGWVTVTKSDGAFTFGTTAFNASNVTAAFTDAPSILDNLSSATAASTLKLTKG